MRQSPTANCFVLVILSFFLLTGCIKTSLPTDNSSSDTNSDGPPDITAVGTPTGAPSTAVIGSAGGSLNSPDGKFTLTVPAGALNSDLSISIQPVTNEAPGGIGIGYDLQPTGTKFNSPVTLTYHYSDIDLFGTSPYFLIPATQDSIGEWLPILSEGNIDTVAKTVSFTTPHFSSYVVVTTLRFEFGQFVFQENEANYVKAVRTKFGTSKIPTAPGDDYLPPLPVKSQVPDQEVSHWSVNHQGTTTIYGNIIGSGGRVNFQAPDHIEKEQIVEISAELDGNYGIKVNNKIVSLKHVILIGRIKLVPRKLIYDVKFDLHQAGTNECFIDNYTDETTAEVDVTGDAVEVPTAGIINQGPSTSPTSGKDNSGTETCSWVPDGTGMLNISDGSGTVSPPADQTPPNGDRRVTVFFNQQSTFYPKWKNVAWDGTTDYSGGQSLNPPLAVSFILNDQTQVQTFTVPSANGEADIKITVTPRQ